MEGNTYEFRIDMDPVPKGRPRFGNGRTYTPSKTLKAEALLKILVAKQFRKPPLEGPLYVGISFNIKRPKSVKRPLPTGRADLDNYIKTVFDSLNQVVWKDDSQIVDISASKRYAPGPAYIEIQVTEL